jgi:hypothetical protein
MDEGGAVAVVRALYETMAAGEDPSPHLTGPLADAVRIELLAARDAVVAARSFVERRIVLVRETGSDALVAVDGEHRLAYQSDGEWKPHVARVHGLARARRTDEGWKVTDLPSGKLSALRSVGVVGPVELDGDLDFELAVSETPKHGDFYVVPKNHGERALTISHVEIETRMFRRLPFVAPIPLSRSVVIGPLEDTGFRFRDVHPYRCSRGTLRLAARDETGRTHLAQRAFGPATRAELATRRGRIISQTRVLEAGAVLFAFTPLAPWWLWPLLVGGLLLLASVTRLPPLLFMLRHGGRGVGLELSATVAAAEFIAGTILIFYDDRSWTTVAVWVTLVGIAFPALRQILTPKPRT